MAKGRYNISVSPDSNLKEGGSNNNETELENQECMNSCLTSAFLRSLSFHDRPRSSRVPTKKELRKSRYKALASSSLEKIPSNPLPSSRERLEYSARRGFESIGIDAEVGITTHSTIYDASSSDAHQQTNQNQFSGANNWLEDRYSRFDVEFKKLLKKTISTLRAVDKDISESLTNLTKPESIALESVTEVYKNRVKNTADCSAVSEFDSSTKSSTQPVYENWRPPVQQTPEDLQVHSTPGSKDLQPRSSRQIPNELQNRSPLQIPKNLQAQGSQLSPKNLQAQSSQLSPKNLQAQSSQHSPKYLQAQSSQQCPKDLQAQSSQQCPKNLQAQSSQQTLRNLQSLLSSNLENPRSVKQNPTNGPSSSKINTPHDAKVKFLMEFDLPSDHEQFIAMIGALQSRCLEYREMIQDIAVLALEECLNFSELSISEIRRLLKQFESQKRNFRDFKTLCCKSVVFGAESQPIDEQVTEVIQSFYLKLLQEENETFMTSLEFGLKTAEIYAKMLKFENESRDMITMLEKEILYLKKISVGFKV